MTLTVGPMDGVTPRASRVTIEADEAGETIGMGNKFIYFADLILAYRSKEVAPGRFFVCANEFG